MRSASCALFVALCAATASAQTKAVLGKDNAVFARGLLEAGYDDLAEGLARVMRDNAGGADSQDELALQALALDIRQLRATRESDPSVRVEQVLAVIADKNAFLADNSRGAVPEAMRAALPDAYLVLGDALAKALKAETDPSKAAALRTMGQTIFADAEAALIERIERFREQMNDPSVDSERARRQVASGLYSLGVIYYFHSLVYPDGDPEQKKVLAKSRDTFLDFGLDFQTDLLNYRGMVFQGLCHRALGKEKQALSDFNDAIALRTQYGEANGQGVFDAVPADAADVVSWAVQEKANMLAEQGKHEEALAAARDYFATIPEPLTAERGLSVLLLRAREEKALNKNDEARATADELVAADPNGQYGNAGRQLLGELMVSGNASGGAAGMLRIAETFANGGEFARALDLCRQAREQSLGSAEAASVGAQSFMLQGAIFARMQRMPEAAVAFDLVAELYPSNERAGDGLWSAVVAYQDLGRADRGPFYPKRIKERMLALATRFPNHPRAAFAQIVEGGQLESNGEWQKAIELYQKVRAGAAGYEEAQFKAGNALYRLARKVAAEGKADEATANFKRAEEQLRAAITILDRAAAATLDREVQLGFNNNAFQARGVLGNLLLERQQPEEVEALFADAETRYPNDASKLGKIWSLRIQARIQRGKLDEAVGLLDSLIQKDPSGLGIAGAAGVVARALDQAGVDELAKDPASDKVAPLWRKAAYYYGLNVKPQLDGTEVLDDETVLIIAQRLIVMGLNFNGVPERATSFIDWQGKPTDTEVWERAVEIFRKLLKQAPSTPATVQLARTLGLLGRYAEANQIYAELFDREKLFTSAGKLDANVLKNKADLFDAYLEWGVTELLVGKAEADKSRLSRASGIFDRMVENTQNGQQRWWLSKYYQVLTLYERGVYNDAHLALNDLRRTQSDKYDDDRFGLLERFKTLEADVKKKVR